MKKVRVFIAIITITASYSLTAQVLITTDGSASDSSAMLEVKSKDKGMLIPRVALTGTTDLTTIRQPAQSLIIYNTDTATGLGFYYWNDTVWVPVSKTADGSETKVTPGTNVTVTGVGGTTSPYVVNASGASTCSVGDFAHGGIVFWVDETGEHGLVCAKKDQKTSNNPGAEFLRWMAGKWDDTWARGDGPYAGDLNTSIIIAATVAIGDDADTFAARVCNELHLPDSGITYGDWYLPSKYELNLMYQNKAIIDSTATAPGNGGSTFYYGRGEHDYWSSTERSAYHAWYQSLTTGHQTDQKDKARKHRIRAVRAF